MNKKAEFNWGIFAVAIFCALLVGLMIQGFISVATETQEKFDSLCEKKDMEYFDYNDGSWGNKGTVICIDNNGEQHEVKLK